MKSYYRTPIDACGINSFMLFLMDKTNMNPQSIKSVCKWLDISDKTMKRYIDGSSPVPRAVCFALYHETQWGRNLAGTEQTNERALLYQRIAIEEKKNKELSADLVSLRAEMAALEKPAHRAANDMRYGQEKTDAPKLKIGLVQNTATVFEFVPKPASEDKLTR